MPCKMVLRRGSFISVTCPSQKRAWSHIHAKIAKLTKMTVTVLATKEKRADGFSLQRPVSTDSRQLATVPDSAKELTQSCSKWKGHDDDTSATAACLLRGLSYIAEDSPPYFTHVMCSLSGGRYLAPIRWRMWLVDGLMVGFGYRQWLMRRRMQCVIKYFMVIYTVYDEYV
jgi:hypothetical protein